MAEVAEPRQAFFLRIIQFWGVLIFAAAVLALVVKFAVR